jgi:2,3-dihydro-2,3-dihydroxybenzoate dehydrogenase
VTSTATATLASLLGPPKPAVIVGSAHGIGFEVCRQLVSLGMSSRLLMVDLDPDALTDSAESLRLAHPNAVIETLHADVRDESALAGALDRFGSAGLACVVAGIAAHAPMLTMTEQVLRDVIDVDLIGAMLAARTLARHLAAGTGGSIVAVTSTAGREPHLDQANYAAAKAGLAQAMRVLGLEMAPHGVRVNCVAPGLTETRLVRDFPHKGDLIDGDHDRYRNRIPRGKLASPEEMAIVIAVLLSDAMAHVYLQELVVDGGETLGR